jgi:WD40 repeat protein
MLVDMSDLSISRVFANAGGPVTSLAISKDGHYIAAGTWNGLVKVWDLDSGKLIISNL